MSITLPTFAELYDLAKLEIESKNTKLTDFNEGSVLDVHCGSSAAVGTELVYQLGRILKAFYIQTAEAEDLDNRLKDYNIFRKQAVSASGSATITRPTTNSYETIRSQTTFKCADGTEFYNEDDIVFDIGTASKIVILIAKVPGIDGNVLGNTIVTISPKPISNFTITHDSFNTGMDEETDDQLRSRFYLEISNLSRGTQQALLAAALRHDGVSAAAIEKVHSGFTRVYIDAGSGTPTDELIQEVQSDIDYNWKAAGEQVTVVSAQTNSIDVTGNITVDLEYADQATQLVILDTVKESVAEYLRTKPMGDALYRAEIISLVMGVTGVKNFILTVPATDISGQSSKIIRPGVISIDIE